MQALNQALNLMFSVLQPGHDQHSVHDTVEVFDPERGVWQDRDGHGSDQGV